MKDRGGYTLVEVLIFVTLTSFLLIAAVTTLNRGRANTEFSQAIRDIESQIADIINDVPTGAFPTNATVSCTLSPGPRPNISDSGNAGLGRSNECIYAGKALQFFPDGDGENVLVYTLAGRRLTDSLNPVAVENLDDALPVAIASTGPGGFDDTVQEIRLQNGLEVDRVFWGDTALPTPGLTERYAIVALLPSFGGTIATIGTQTQEVAIGGIAGSAMSLPLTKDVAVTSHINNLSSTTFQTATNGIVICLVNQSDKRASLTIGAAGASGVQLDIDNYNEGCNP